MPRKTTQAQKSKKEQDSRSIKELFILRKKALLSQHKVRKTSKKSKKTSLSWLDSMQDRIYNGFSQTSVFVSWSISWLLCFGLWAVLLYLVWQELLWWGFV
ncbi:hypothetical protein HCN_1083 [Helicobacter cinaedi PAGU611]|uniref:Uncharacterized protein n=1 Tax=Helicobacter cinaedi CCUG 18818 = ATCC BAA-847 TaxID=537971 RepID=A0AAI8QGV2_9HELI|nr:hypothetical protein [Helicobacter cinaedi]AWK61883.1 hypothetical protein C6B36_05600 [Helicobacter cinaedi]EFR46668.1 hypothetical protein HCCG_01215 [Helicobacter cinaedi CCUG 18818 = ATCC BAA-847]QOQ91783.1 hypothetical protein HW260_05675 [Helicobacter cinaedi]QOQ95984.1 hypothetical protein HW245_10450 [Helicobacter cinaedi]BAM12311.1 hypothetical protein HCN_1083 [Helicobacter cinaedi PAGU611]